jgi:hypothetical protein
VARGLLGYVLNLVAAYFVLVGGLVILLTFLDQLPILVATEEEGTPEALAGVAAMLTLLLQVLLGLVLAFLPLLGPIVVVEESSTGKALRLWWQFLREQGCRLFVYEGLAVVLAVVASLPMLLPVWVATLSGLLPAASTLGGPWSDAWNFTMNILYALALTPFVAFLVVANLYLYLNLRYEQRPRRNPTSA